MQKITIPSLVDFDMDDDSISNNHGMLGEMSASAYFGDDHLFVFSAKLHVLNSDSSDDDERSKCKLSMEITLDDVVIASVDGVDYEYSGDEPGDHLAEDFELGLDGVIVPIFVDRARRKTDEFDFSVVLSHQSAQMTDGPWGESAALSSDTAHIRYITGPDAQRIAKIEYPKGMSQDEALANARAIKLAPDMAAFIKEASVILQQHPDFAKGNTKVHYLAHKCAALVNALK